VSFGGNAVNTGTVNSHYSAQTIEAIQGELSKLERELHSANLDEALTGEVLKYVQDAKVDPSPDKLHKVTTRIRELGEVVLAGSAIWEISHLIAKLAGFA
jgi:hypothetical protein